MAAKAVHVDLELWCLGSPLTQGVPLKGPLKGFLQGIYKGFYGVSLFFLRCKDLFCAQPACLIQGSMFRYFSRLGCLFRSPKYVSAPLYTGP